MQLQITPSKLVSEVQDDFNRAFPFLKLEFYQYKKGDGNLRHSSSYARRIGEYQAIVTDGSVDINPEMKVGDLEMILKDKFALNAQVFRRSGTLWLQTTMTDNWTLQKQNEHGMELSRVPEQPIINREDINNDA